MSFELFWENFDQWKFLAGLGIFLFGMFLIEESIRRLSGKAFRNFLQVATSNRIKSILSGAFTTAILQSSFAVSLMALAFVGARILAMENAMGVVLGSNLGTTATTWIVATLGFKVRIESFSLPMIGIGGLGTILLGKSEKYSNISKLVSGFGFLFMGLDYMKVSIANFTSNIDISTIPNYGLFVYVGIGAFLTAIMMSSSASLAVSMTAFHAGLMDFVSTCAFFIGANIGNVLPLILTSIGGPPQRKRIVAGHFLFNLITGFIFYFFLPLVKLLIIQLEFSKETQVQGLALFHTIFNGVGIILFYPFLNQFTIFLTRLFPDKKNNYTVYISQTSPIYPEAGLHSLRKELIRMVFIVIYHNSIIILGKKRTRDYFWFFPSDFNLEIDQESEEIYNYIKNLQYSVFTYSAKLQESTLSQEESEKLQKLIQSAQSLLYSAKYSRYIIEDWKELEESGNKFIENEMESLIEYYISVLSLILKNWQHIENYPISEIILAEAQLRTERQNSFTKRMGIGIEKKNFPKSFFTTILNTQRAIYQSYDYLFAALQNLFPVSES